MKKGLLVVALMVTVLLSALPAVGQDPVKAEIRQAIDTAYLDAYWNGMDIKAFLAGWDQGALSPVLEDTGEVTLFKLKTGRTIVQIATDEGWTSMFFPPRTRPQ